MLKNYIKIAWRSLKKQPFYTLLNVTGLAIGIAGVLLISLYVRDEFSYDKMFLDADRIHRINADVKFGGEVDQFAEVSAPMAKTILQDYPQIEAVTRFRNVGSSLVKREKGEVNVKEKAVTYVDTSFFEMFGVNLIAGNTSTALKQPGTIVITKSAASKHFPVDEAVGRSLILDNDESFEIAGVIEDFPENSFLRNHTILISMEGFEDSKLDRWGSHNYPTFIKLSPQGNVDDLQVLMQSMLGRYVIPWVQGIYPGITEEQFQASGNYLRFSTIPLTDIHLHSNRNPEMSDNGSMQNVYILSFIALFLLVLASVNFMNLATAQSLKRSKEVGIRKTLGSSKQSLVAQFLTEASLTSFISLLLGIFLAWSVLPLFNDLANKQITIPLFKPLFIFGMIGGTLMLGILSGLYPAFFMSRFKPVQVLKGNKKGISSSGGVRNILVIFQFGISICLIVCTLVVFKQLKYIQSKELGYKKDQILLVEDAYGVGNNLSVFKQEVSDLSQVESVSISSYLPTSSARSSSSYFREGERNQETALNMENWIVDYDYIPTLDMDIVAGRNFSRDYGTDSSAIIINETALEVLGMTADEVLGIRISGDLDDPNPEFSTIIGVVKNFHFENFKEDIGALSLSLGTSRGFLVAKINTSDIENTVSSIESIWNQKAMGLPFTYSFMDEAYDEIYDSEQRLGKIFVIFTILSIFIACLGLFGLAALNTEKRRKEIGIRKVLGASVAQIFYQLTLDFLKLVAVAILIALPVAYLIMNQWLQDFTYKVEIGWLILLITSIIAIAISVLTVGYQSIKAATANPVGSLRAE